MDKQFSEKCTAFQGVGSLEAIALLLAMKDYKSVYLVSDSDSVKHGFTETITDLLRKNRITYEIASVNDTVTVTDHVRAYQKSNSDSLIALGGNKIMNLVENIAVQLTKNDMESGPVFTIFIPTDAGTAAFTAMNCIKVNFVKNPPNEEDIKDLKTAVVVDPKVMFIPDPAEDLNYGHRM